MTTGDYDRLVDKIVDGLKEERDRLSQRVAELEADAARQRETERRLWAANGRLLKVVGETRSALLSGDGKWAVENSDPDLEAAYELLGDVVPLTPAP